MGVCISTRPRDKRIFFALPPELLRRVGEAVGRTGVVVAVASCKSLDASVARAFRDGVDDAERARPFARGLTTRDAARTLRDVHGLGDADLASRWAMGVRLVESTQSFEYDIQYVALLLAAGADPDAVTERFPSATALQRLIASAKGMDSVGDEQTIMLVTWLLDAGADVNKSYDNSMTPLACALVTNHLRIADELLPPTEALVAMRFRVAEILVRRGADIVFAQRCYLRNLPGNNAAAIDEVMRDRTNFGEMLRTERYSAQHHEAVLRLRKEVALAFVIAAPTERHRARGPKILYRFVG
mmetsp:Transcript_23622/g.72974  ORF Transcript_23622/g.72974 Transcript_23622/m.72974 type:complete len:300 (-) Transcript_23622:19-918(-)